MSIRRGGFIRRAVFALLAAALAVWMLPRANGHVLGDGYVFIATEGVEIMARAELPLPSVVQAIGVDWLGQSSLDEHFSAVEDYIGSRLAIRSGTIDMPMVVQSLSIIANPLGEYLIVTFERHAFDAPVETLSTSYGLFFDDDEEHRGVLVVQDKSEYDQASETGTEVFIFTPGRREQTVPVVSPKAIEYGRSAEPGSIERITRLLAPVIGGALVLGFIGAWLISRRSSNRLGATGDRRCPRRGALRMYLAVSGGLLLIAGGVLLAVGAIPLRQTDWVLLQVRFDGKESRNHQVEWIAGRDAVYEVEVTELAPRKRDERQALIAEREGGGYPDVDWSVRNPHGRVAAGNGSRVSYLRELRVEIAERVVQGLMATPLMPDATLSLRRRDIRKRWLVAGIGQWRARKGQTYWLSVAQSAAASSSSDSIGVRFRLRRQSWRAEYRRQKVLLEGGLLTTLLGISLFVAGWCLRPRAGSASM